jgi:MFS family permease
MSFALALFALILSAGAMGMVSLYPQDTQKYTFVAFLAFLVYEVAVGMYFPAVGYLRSQIIPEQYRASITNWYRVPMNIFTCLSLLWFKNSGHSDKEFAFDTAVSSLKAFLMCSILLFLAILLCKLLKRGNENIKLIMESV